jgi:hypothetical protein
MITNDSYKYHLFPTVNRIAFSPLLMKIIKCSASSCEFRKDSPNFGSYRDTHLWVVNLSRKTLQTVTSS